MSINEIRETIQKLEKIWEAPGGDPTLDPTATGGGPEANADYEFVRNWFVEHPGASQAEFIDDWFENGRDWPVRLSGEFALSYSNSAIRNRDASGGDSGDSGESSRQNPQERQDAITKAWLSGGHHWEKHITDPEDVAKFQKLVANAGGDPDRVFNKGPAPRPAGYERGTGKPMKGADGVKTRDELGLGPNPIQPAPKQSGPEGGDSSIPYGRTPGLQARKSAAQEAGFSSLADARQAGHPSGSAHTWTGSGAFEWTGSSGYEFKKNDNPVFTPAPKPKTDKYGNRIAGQPSATGGQGRE